MAVTVDQLREVALFSELDDETLDRIVLQGREVEWRAGQTVIKEEDRKGEVFHLILTGTADVSAHGTPVAKAGPGEYFGELSLLDGKPRSAQVAAETDLVTFSIASWHFERLMDEQPALRRQMVMALCDRIRSLTEALSM
ncbi:MAG TPA: cyclic nucleotide-binding domain-containing protein [Actinomycetota bacterium]|nr:cyclic nucleotide-binding domain-containing protein [Actinomycetota bacterium]